MGAACRTGGLNRRPGAHLGERGVKARRTAQCLRRIRRLIRRLARSVVIALALSALSVSALAQSLQWVRVPAGGPDTVAATAPAAPAFALARDVAPGQIGQAGQVGHVRPLGQRARGHDAAPAALQYGELVSDVARRHALDPLLVHAVVAAESGYRPAVVSSKGAVGLMQVTRATGARFGKTALDEPRDNLEAGSAYLSWLMQYFGGRLDLALAGYNAGEGAVTRYGNVVPPYAETQTYVRRVLAHYTSLRAQDAGALPPDVVRTAAAVASPPAVARAAGAPTTPTTPPPAARAARSAPTPAAPRAAPGMGDMGQWWQLFTSGSGHADARSQPRH